MPVIEYRGWKNNLLLTNGEVEVVVTLDVGPRVICYRVPGGFNVLKNYDEMMGGTLEHEWQIRGGHRFWLAPEDLTRTYFADNRPVAWQQTGPHAAVFTPPPEAEYGVSELVMPPGSTLLLYTDGVTEAETADGEMFGEERLLELFRTKKPRTAEMVADDVVQAVDTFAGGYPQSDDLTLLALVYRGDALPA